MSGFPDPGCPRAEDQQFSYDYDTGAPLSSYDKSAVTPAVGLVVKPLKELSLYTNYVEGLVQGDTAPTTRAV